MVLSRGRVLVLAGAATLVILLTPFPSHVVRPWKIQIVDRAGRPVAGCRVIESWMWSSIDSNLRTFTRNTDPSGWVEFPEHTKWASLQQRLRGRIKSQFTYHGGRYGPYVMIMAVKGEGRDGVVSVSFNEQTRGVVDQNGVLTYRAQLLTSEEQVERERLITP